MCCIYLTKPYHHHEYLETSTSNAMENKAKVCGSQRRHIHPAAGHRLGNKRKAHTGHHANGQGTLWMHASPRKYTSNCHLRKKGKTISRVIRNASVSSTLVQNKGEERCTHPDRQQWGPKPPAVTNHQPTKTTTFIIFWFWRSQTQQGYRWAETKVSAGLLPSGNSTGEPISLSFATLHPLAWGPFLHPHRISPTSACRHIPSLWPSYLPLISTPVITLY